MAGTANVEQTQENDATATSDTEVEDVGFPLPQMEVPPFQTILVLNANGSLTLRGPSTGQNTAQNTSNSGASTQQPPGETCAPTSDVTPNDKESRKFALKTQPKWLADSSQEDMDWWSDEANKSSKVRLCKDAWFNVFRFLTVTEIAMHHRVNKEMGDAARMALRRVEKLDLWHTDRTRRGNILDAVLRGGCGSLKELHVTGTIDAVGKVVQAATNIDQVIGLAPNLLSKHLRRDVPTLTRLSLWVDANFSDDLSIVADRLRNLKTLQLTATQGITVYDQQVANVFESCTQLETVQLRGIHCTDDIAETFHCLTNLKALRLEDARLTDEILAVLIKNLGTKQLKRLSVRHNSITPQGVKLIGASQNLKQSLTGLEISHAGDIYSGTFHMVCNQGFLPKLKHLRVAPRLQSVFKRNMAKTRPDVQVGSHALL